MCQTCIAVETQMKKAEDAIGELFVHNDRIIQREFNESTAEDLRKSKETQAAAHSSFYDTVENAKLVYNERTFEAKLKFQATIQPYLDALKKARQEAGVVLQREINEPLSVLNDIRTKAHDNMVKIVERTAESYQFKIDPAEQRRKLKEEKNFAAAQAAKDNLRSVLLMVVDDCPDKKKND